MNRPLARVAAAVLWLLAGWGAGDFIAYAAGVSGPVGPLLGLALADFVAGDPFHLIWTHGQARSPQPARLSQADAVR